LALVASIVACLVMAAVSFASKSGDVDPAVKQWSGWQGRVLCGSVPFKPLRAFSRPTDAASGKRPSEVALRKYIEGGGIGSASPDPLRGWRLLGEKPDVAEFGKGSLSRGFVNVLTMRRGKHGWEWSEYDGGCLPRVIRRHSLAITWTLAGDQQVTASTKSIKVKLGPGECAGERLQSERLEVPSFRVENGALLMALFLHPLPPGGYTCQAMVEKPVTIRLPHRLGRLKLLDGSVFPPQPPVEGGGH
jgi:hypothetical protein